MKRKPLIPYIVALVYTTILISLCYIYTLLPLSDSLHVLTLTLVTIIAGIHGVVEPLYAYNSSKINNDLSLIAGKMGYRTPVLIKRGPPPTIPHTLLGMRHRVSTIFKVHHSKRRCA